MLGFRTRRYLGFFNGIFDGFDQFFRPEIKDKNLLLGYLKVLLYSNFRKQALELQRDNFLTIILSEHIKEFDKA